MTHDDDLTPRIDPREYSDFADKQELNAAIREEREVRERAAWQAEKKLLIREMKEEIDCEFDRDF